MITLFIFKSNSLGMQYGAGTYINELTNALSLHKNIRIYLINYYSNCGKEFTVKELNENFIEVNLPSTMQPCRDVGKYVKGTVLLLSDLIEKSENVIFHFNFHSEIQIAAALKQSFPYPCVGVVHIADWQQKQLKQEIQENYNTKAYAESSSVQNKKEFYRLMDKVICLTRSAKHYLLETLNVDLGKIEIVPNGVALHKVEKRHNEEKKALKKQYGFGTNEKIILYVGRIDEEKGIYFLLKAFLKAHEADSKLRLLIVGSGDIHRFLKECPQLFGRVSFTGFLEKKKVAEICQIAHIGVLPSFHEQCSYTVLEMIREGVPLILSRVDGLKEMLDDSQCVFINPKETDDGHIEFDADEFAVKILELAMNRQKADSIRRNALKALSEKFDSAIMGEKMNNIYKSVLIKNGKDDENN